MIPVKRVIRKLSDFVIDVFESDYEKSYRSRVSASYFRKLVQPVSYDSETKIFLMKDGCYGKGYCFYILSITFPQIFLCR